MNGFSLPSSRGSHTRVVLLYINSHHAKFLACVLALAVPRLQLPHQLAYLNQSLPIKPEEPEKPGTALGTMQYGSVCKVLLVLYYSVACGVARMDFAPLSAL